MLHFAPAKKQRAFGMVACGAAAGTRCKVPRKQPGSRLGIKPVCEGLIQVVLARWGQTRMVLAKARKLDSSMRCRTQAQCIEVTLHSPKLQCNENRLYVKALFPCRVAYYAFISRVRNALKPGIPQFSHGRGNGSIAMRLTGNKRPESKPCAVMPTSWA